MCTNRTSPRMSKIRMLPSQPTLVFVGITGLEPAPSFLTPVPKTGRIPITDYIPSFIVPQKGIEPPKSYLYARDLQSPELTTCSTTAFIVGKLGYAPNPIVFQTIASTKLASTPIVGCT